MASKTIQATGAKGHHTFVLTVNETYVGNGAENFSKLSFSLTCNPRSWDWYGWGNMITYSINIGGNTYTGSIPDMVANTTNTIRSESNIEIPHNNDGTKNISISFSITDTANQSYTSGNCSTSGTFDLTTILRYPQLSFDSFSVELNRISVTVSNSLGLNMDKYQCAKVSDGTVVTSGDLTSTSSATFYISSLTPNTSYSGTYKVRGYSNGGWGDWITLTNSNMKTTTLPTVSSTANTSIENAVRIQFSNLNFIQKWSFNCKTYNDNTSIRTGSNITTNNYDITLTSAQIDTLLRKYTGTTKPKVYWEITITSNGTNYRVYVSGTTNPTTEYSIPDTATYQPTFPDTYITEVKNTQTTISGANKFIKNHNQLSLKITPMGGKYGTTGKNYTIVCGSKTKSVNYSSSAQTVTIDNIDGSSISITAVDNRGKATLVNVGITLIDYSKPTIAGGNMTRQNGTGTYAYLNANGKYTNWSGLNQTNSIQEIKYRSKQSGTSTWSEYTAISTTTNTGGNWTVVNNLLSTVFTNTLSYDVELYIKDRLEATTYIFSLSTADVFIWRDLANKRFGINKKPNYTLDANGDINSSGILREKGAQLTEIDITNTTNTLLSRVQALASNSIYQATWFVKTDGGSSGITDKPTGTTNAGFVCYANCNRHNGTTDWRYILTAFVQGTTDYYIAVVTNDTTTISWGRPINGKAPTSHAASGTTYGVGTASNYGHCRVINNLTTASATNGYALQAYQGKVLNDKITTTDGKHNYSTTETAIGTWIDGKTLYRKVLNVGSISFVGGSQKKISHGISGLSRVVHFEYSMYYNSNSYWYKNWDMIDRENITISSTEIIFNVGGTGGTTTFANCCIILEYTK